MNKTSTPNQHLFDLHLEYSASVAVKEKEYRELEGKFGLVFGFLPVQIEDNTFPYLTDRQQDACRAFWGNLRVVRARHALTTARTLAEAYFNAYADQGKK